MMDLYHVGHLHHLGVSLQKQEVSQILPQAVVHLPGEPWAILMYYRYYLLSTSHVPGFLLGCFTR